ncbi:BZ3500_MvSof-1268-A1-R1_Chr1-3g01842 [Microbotryum saponariae]|uniref:BZ3500_MvSof-1268-A1-R1_Chr1-3g01842 protein n=1 Tax=Microbotryum saponariae TaxID=289078 RepID=A0A2X0L7C9_9BASI|nr:BZ3500_MvSof-1268-A1-R1_Chr1-3g01842 [Microbotryum saponariae]SCZ94731.1 BZ3501_MvSof-1269-A2-R1_Chr1-3g01444 [Microbotryum saponariae]
MVVLSPQGFCSQLDMALAGHVGRSLPDCFSISEAHVVGLFLGVHPSERLPNTNGWTYASVYQQRLRNKPGPWAEMAVLHTQVVIAQLVRLYSSLVLSGCNRHECSSRLSYTRVQYLRPDPTVGAPPLPSEGDSITACAKQHELVNVLYKYLVSEQKPTGSLVPLLLQVCNDLRLLSIAADDNYLAQKQKPRALEETSRLLQKCFSACLNDRNGSVNESKKPGTWYMATLLFKTYFRLKSSHLCKSIVRGINAAGLTGFAAIPKGHQTTYTYYMGVLAFLREDYTEAEVQFSNALGMVHHRAFKNIERILSYLIPIMLLRGILPTQRNLKKAGRLETIYRPFIEAYKSGNVQAYDLHLLYTEKRLMERGTYLVVERAREGVVRNLIKKAWILEGKPPRMSVADLRRYCIAGSGDETVDSDEMECILANLIGKVSAQSSRCQAYQTDFGSRISILGVFLDQGFIKGYISHSHGMVVLSKDRPFPWAAPYRPLEAAARADRDRREAENAKKVVVSAAANP